MDKKESLEFTDLWVEMGKNGKGETWSRGTNLRLPFDVNVMLNLSIISFGGVRGDFRTCHSKNRDLS